MIRLINGDALIELINGGYDLDFDEVPETKRELLRMIMEQPTVNALPYEYIENLEKELLTEDEIERLMQCVTCEKSPRDCGCDDSDEDENGMCIKWERKEE